MNTRPNTRLVGLAVLSILVLSIPGAARPVARGAPASDAPLSLTEALFQRGATARAEGRADDARAAWSAVLERDQRHLPALAGLARLEAEGGSKDLALMHASAFLDTWRHVKEKPRELRKEAEALAALTSQIDPLASRWNELRRSHVTALLKLAGERMDKGAWHAARAIQAEAAALDPEHPELAAGRARVETEGGNELARADDAGGADLFADVTPEWIAKNDPKHVDWSQAWELGTEHYRVRTNAGYQALQVTANAMEQMQGFYCIFHEHDGSVPKVGVHIYRDRAEYMDIGGAPVEWAGGHWDGSNVVTYDQRGGNQGSLRDVLQTLFHEASHQFTDICGGSGVPAWLNEGMASFFEGTRLLSNGQVEWNLVAPGRLYPLLDDLRSPKRNHLVDVIEGEVDD